MFGKKPVLGIEIGSNSIKAARIKQPKKQVLGCVKIYFEEDIIENGRIKDKEKFKNAINEILSSKNMKKDKAVISIPNENIKIKYLDEPEDEKDKLDMFAEIGFQEHFSLEKEEAIFGYKRILKPYSDYQEKAKLLLAAVEEKIVIEYVDILNECGINVVAVEPSIVSIERLFSNYCLKGNTGIVDLGHTKTEVVVLEDGALESNVVISNYSDKEESEKFISDLKKAIGNSKSLILTGGLSYSDEIKEFIENSVGIKTVTIDVFGGLLSANKSIEPIIYEQNYFSTALGLALRGGIK